MTADLFSDLMDDAAIETFDDGVVVLRRYALPWQQELMSDIDRVARQSPFRQMRTPGGHKMSVAMTCCGPLGWVTDKGGYRYQHQDPITRSAWPAMPERFSELASTAADTAGFPGFEPDACLVNRYQPGAKMGLHQDKDEQDFAWPIVSVSLGLPVMFQFGGLRRSDRPERILLEHGDVIVWGGPARLRYHGVLSLKPGEHPVTGSARYNLTFRKAG
ncbi:DNA oxidative demethylase AlkB [Marinobacter sp. VGCF2001]|uniref:DNA oxidative demethylase AlkB n=1 Tax=Marinobacter sp. VGCF2001 TaxID=3417189 RepID=UPI003CFB1F95